MTKSVLCLTLMCALPVLAPAQQTTSPPLPDAPSQLLFAGLSSSLQNPAAPQQTTSTQPDAQQDQPPQTDEQRRAEGDREIKVQTQQRMLGIVPAFNEVIGGKAVPLTPGQKFHLFFRGSIDPYQFVIAGLDSGIEQVQHEYPEYHYGIEGYAKRYGASFADNWDGNFWGNAVLPSVFHQDPRYFRLGRGSALHRILYTASTAIRCRGDNGKWQPNYSNVLGNFIGGAISNVYYPASDRGVSLTLERGLTVTAEGILGALAEEFYPDLGGYLQRKKARKLAAAAAAAPVPDPAPQNP